LTAPRDAAASQPGYPSAPWFDPSTFRADLGIIFAGDQHKNSHTHSIRNRSANPVTILSVANEKPCCGQIDAPKTPLTLQPGAIMNVTVTLHSITTAIGRVQHLASIQSDDPGSPSIALETIAAIQPLATIDERPRKNTPLFPGDSDRVICVVQSYGTTTQPPARLDDHSLMSDAKFEWLGPQTSKSSTDQPNLLILRRECAIILEAKGEPGPRFTDVCIRSPENLDLRQTRIHWEVAPAIKAAPSGLVLTYHDADPAIPILLTSQDGRAFRILSTNASLKCATLQVANPSALTTHILKLHLTKPPPGTNICEITVATDHPRQPETKITIYLRDNTSATTGDSP
jgi:hypothetical protein